MRDAARPVTILVVEDSPDDCDIFRDAVQAARLANPVEFVEDGAEALDYLRGRGPYADRERHPRPGLVFLDINLPRVNGLDVLAAVRDDPGLRGLPVVVLTVSGSDEDVLRSYELDSMVFIQKPVSSLNLSAVIQSLDRLHVQVVDRAG